MSNNDFQNYLSTIPSDRVAITKELREGFLKVLPSEVVEEISGDMVRYIVPLDLYPKTYNKKPLLVAMFANKKTTLTLTLTGLTNSSALREELKRYLEKVDSKLASSPGCLKLKKMDVISVNKIMTIQKKLSYKNFIKNYESLMNKK